MGAKTDNIVFSGLSVRGRILRIASAVIALGGALICYSGSIEILRVAFPEAGTIGNADPGRYDRTHRRLCPPRDADALGDLIPEHGFL